MSSNTIIKGMMAMCVAFAVHVSASDNVLVFDYSESSKWFSSDQDKVVTSKYTAYLLFTPDFANLGQVWYWKDGTKKQYSAYYNYDYLAGDVECDYILDFVGGTGGIVNFYSGSCVLGYLNGYGTVRWTKGSLSSLSATGTITDPGLNTGTFSLRYNSSLTKKAISYDLDAIDLVIYELEKKGYVAYE